MTFLSKRLLITTCLIVSAVSLVLIIYVYFYSVNLRNRNYNEVLREMESIASAKRDIFIANTILEQAKAIQMLEEELKRSRGLQFAGWLCSAAAPDETACNSGSSASLNQTTLEFSRTYLLPNRLCCSLKMEKSLGAATAAGFYRRQMYILVAFTGFIIIVASIGIGITMKYYFAKPMARILRVIDHLSNDKLEVDIGSEQGEFAGILKKLQNLGKTILNNQKVLAGQQSLVAIGSTTAMVAHDVRKPLASMKALLASLPDIKDDPAQMKKMISSVDRNIAQTNAMLDEILEFSRDSTSLVLKECDTQAIITSALCDALRNHEGSNVKIEYDFNHLHALRVDCVRIIRVLTNIIDNALGAMTSPHTIGPSGCLLFKTYEIARDGGQYGGIVISDNGPGIPKEALEKLFDPFFTLGKKGGTGLGLAICQRVINLHGGKIWAGNRGEGGAQFTVELPRGCDRVGIKETELIRYSGELDTFRKEESMRTDFGNTANIAEFLRLNKARGRESYILLVDDEPLFRETLRSFLNGLREVRDHIKIIEADSAETALQICAARDFDYVIADIDLGRGRMNGYEFAQMVLKKYPNAHVLIHSNKRKGEMDRNIRSTASDKFMGFLPKPMRSAELLQFLACKTFEVPSNHRTIEPSNKKNVLVVNDDDSLIVAFKIQLRSPDVQVLSAGNVSDALKRITEQKVDVILSDINLGSNEPSGYELLKKVREKDKSVPFYMVSGYSEADEGPKARGMGATGYLQLPVEGAQLKKTILPTSS